jgi:ribosomal protein S25
MNVWNMVQNQTKWIAYNQSQIKRKEMDDDSMNEGGGLEDIEVPRPMGQKKAKKAAHEDKGKIKESAINMDELDRFEKIQNDVHVNRLKLLEMQGKIYNDKMEPSKIALQRAKEDKDVKLIEKESKMMEIYSNLLVQDTSGMDGDMKAEHVTALRCLRKKLFLELS